MAIARVALLTLFGLMGCDQGNHASIGALASEQTSVPAFSISISLSPAATRKLGSVGEGVVVGIFLDGDGQPEAGVKTAPHRDVFLGNAQAPVDENNVARFTGLTVSSAKLKRLYNPDYFIGVNAYSARRSTKLNVLNCGFAEGRVSEVSKTGLKLHCTLIDEPAGVQPMGSNNAVESDALHPALRASYSAPHRER